MKKPIVTLIPGKGVVVATMTDNYEGKCCRCGNLTILHFGNWCHTCWRRNDLEELRDALFVRKQSTSFHAAEAAKDDPPPAWWDEERKHQKRADPQPRH